MAIEYRHFPIRFGGINQKKDPHQLNAGEMLTLENLWMDKTGRLKRRYGYDKITTGSGAGVTDVAVTDWHGDVLRFASDGFYHCDGTNIPNEIAENWVAGSVQMYPLTGELDYNNDFDYAENGSFGVALRVISDRTVSPNVPNIEITFYRKDTRRVFYKDVVLATRAKLCGDNVSYVCLVLCLDDPGAGGSIIARIYPNNTGTSDPTYTSSFIETAVAGLSITHLDTCTRLGYVGLVLGYKSTAVAGETRAYSITLSTGAVSAALSTGTGRPELVSICYARVGTKFGVVYYNDNRIYGSYYRQFDVSTGWVGSEQLIDAGALGGTIHQISVLDDGTRVWYLASWVVRSTTPGGPAIFLHNDAGGWSIKYTLARLNLASRAFLRSSAVWFYAARREVSTEIINNGLGLCRANASSCVRGFETALPSASRPLGANAILPNICENSSSLYTLPVRASAATNNESRLLIRSNTVVPQFAYWNQDLLNNVTPNLRMFDGVRNLPVGWPLYPEAPTSLVGATSPGGYPAGTYGFRAVFVRYDRYGNVSRSAPSTTYSSNLALSYTTLTVGIYAYPFFDPVYDSSDCWIEVYRTVANGALYYLDGRRSLSDLTFSSTYGLMTYTVQTSDTALISNPILYTEGGIIEHVGPPTVKSFALCRDRIWMISADDGRPWYSKPRVKNEAPNFSDAFVLDYVGVDGLQAVSPLDDKTILFGSSNIFSVYGVGPDETGAGSFEVMELDNENGTVQPNSVTFGPGGIMFMSARGIYRIGRDLSMQYIGAPIEDAKSYTVVATIGLSDRDHTWFFTSNGFVLDFDEFHNRWGYHRISAKHAALVGGVPVWMDITGGVYKENSATTTDDGTAIVSKLITGWISLNQLQGFKRIRGLICSGVATTGTLTLKLYYDFIDTAAETFTVSAATVTAAGSYNYQWNVKPKIQRCEAIKVEMSFGGEILSGMAFDVGALPGSFKRPAVTRVTGV
jgi:hypothetical protein